MNSQQGIAIVVFAGQKRSELEIGNMLFELLECISQLSGIVGIILGQLEQFVDNLEFRLKFLMRLYPLFMNRNLFDNFLRFLIIIPKTAFGRFLLKLGYFIPSVGQVKDTSLNFRVFL